MPRCLTSRGSWSHVEPQTSQEFAIGRAVAQITLPDLPIFANDEIGADQSHYFRWTHRGRALPECCELAYLCLAWPKIRVTVADASSADH